MATYQIEQGQTLARARAIIERLRPGDALLFERGGRWETDQSDALKLWNLSGTADDPIMIGAYGSGSTPVIDGHRENVRPVSLRDARHVTVQDLDIRNHKYGAGVRVRGCSNILIRRCSVRDGGHGFENWTAGFIVYGSSNVTFWVCTALHNRGEGFYAGQSSQANPDDVTEQIKLIQCTATHNSADGLDIKGSVWECLVQTSLFSNNGGLCDVALGGHGTVMEDCIVESGTADRGIYLGRYQRTQGEGCTVRRCEVSGNHSMGGMWIIGHENVVDDCLFRDCGIGIYVDYRPDEDRAGHRIVGCRFEDVEVPIKLDRDLPPELIEIIPPGLPPVADEIEVVVNVHGDQYAGTIQRVQDPDVP